VCADSAFFFFFSSGRASFIAEGKKECRICQYKFHPLFVVFQKPISCKITFFVMSQSLNKYSDEQNKAVVQNDVAAQQ